MHEDPPAPDDPAAAPEQPDDPLTNVVVSVDPAHVSTISDVVMDLRAVGMVVDQTMDALGTVAGRIAASRIDTVRTVSGVSAVERSRDVQLPPPGSGIQ